MVMQLYHIVFSQSQLHPPRSIHIPKWLRLPRHTPPKAWLEGSVIAVWALLKMEDSLIFMPKNVGKMMMQRMEYGI
jgi:hypothetical protein